MKLAQMERIATQLDHELMTRERPSKWDDMRELSALLLSERTTKQRLHDVWLNGEPMNVAGGLRGLVQNPVTVNQTTVTGSATEQALIPTTLMPVEQNVQSGKVYYLYAGGTSTTAATPGTYTLASRIGPAPTNASPLFGAVSSAFTPLASMTAAPWSIVGFVVIRGSGTANTAADNFNWSQTSVASTATGGPTSASSGGQIGGISAGFDSTGATCALWIGVTHATSTTNTWIPQLVIWASEN
jgi:hypothetical protein